MTWKKKEKEQKVLKRLREQIPSLEENVKKRTKELIKCRENIRLFLS